MRISCCAKVAPNEFSRSRWQMLKHSALLLKRQSVLSTNTHVKDALTLISWMEIVDGIEALQRLISWNAYARTESKEKRSQTIPDDACAAGSCCDARRRGRHGSGAWRASAHPGVPALAMHAYISAITSYTLARLKSSSLSSSSPTLTQKIESTPPALPPKNWIS